MFKRNSLAAKLICLAFSFFIILCIELACRFIFRETLLDKITAVIKQDPVLFWKQKANIRIKFQGQDVVTDRMGFRNKSYCAVKEKGTIRIICLGASPTFGWGVDYENTYPRQLEKLLQRKNEHNLEVINAGVIGYSSYQGMLSLKNEIIRLDPDIITVSYVLNDIDKYRFFRSNLKPDNTLPRKNRLMISLENFLQQMKLVRVLERLAFTMRQPGITHFDDGKAPYSPGPERVSPSDYQNNLQEIADFCLKNRIKLILIKMPVNLPLQKTIPESSKNDAHAYFASGMQRFQAGDYNQAMDDFLNAIKYDPYLSDAYYYAGVCSEKKHRPSVARIYFTQAKEKEVFRCGSQGILYNGIMESVAKQNNIPLVDITNAFGKIKNKYLFVDEKRDPIHPNASGHGIIALKIYEELIHDREK